MNDALLDDHNTEMPHFLKKKMNYFELSFLTGSKLLIKYSLTPSL